VGNLSIRGIQVAAKIDGSIKPELVEAQTNLARLHFENWLTFLTFLQSQFERLRTHSTRPAIGSASKQNMIPLCPYDDSNAKSLSH
jgi:hypothetical protein